MLEGNVSYYGSNAFETITMLFDAKSNDEFWKGFDKDCQVRNYQLLQH